MLPSLRRTDPRQIELHNGDRMSREEFLRRWEQIPELKQAELIKEVVYLASPVSTARGSYDILLGSWLSFYAYASGQDLLITGNTTLLLDDRSFQPDIAVVKRRQGLAKTPYLEQLPDLVVEISYSSQSYDLGPKLAAYRSAGIRDYITVLLREQRVEWRVLSGSRYRVLNASKDGILRSVNFPGLWLDTNALFPHDRQRLFGAIHSGLAK